MSASSSVNDLRNRILFTIGVLAVYRFGTFVPLPGIDPEQLKILGTGEIKDKINIEANLASKSAVQKLEKIGGSIQLKK